MAQLTGYVRSTGFPNGQSGRGRFRKKGTSGSISRYLVTALLITTAGLRAIQLKGLAQCGVEPFCLWMGNYFTAPTRHPHFCQLPLVVWGASVRHPVGRRRQRDDPVHSSRPRSCWGDPGRISNTDPRYDRCSDCCRALSSWQFPNPAKGSSACSSSENGYVIG